ncbi:MAG: PP2C family protein-serine/threonine phosphatase [Prolixibacteraceae bacterium]|jgi:serine phosphatase RsbU (regulator of sigma subunit)|nr:PP2C family protein-serine/threonine phosphatase [Prolixibacteraceae bacterium]
MKSLAYHLNVNHLTYLVISFAVLFWGNIFLLELTVNKRIETKVLQKGENVFNYIANIEEYRGGEVYEEHLLKQLQNYYFSSSEGCFIYEKDNRIIKELAGNVFSKNVNISDVLLEKIQNYDANKPKVYELDITYEGNSSFVYVSPVNENQNTFFLFYSGNSYIENFGHYPAWHFAMLGFIFIILFWIIWFNNRRLAAPFSEIAQSILHRPESNVNISGKHGESTLIKREINLMQSQLLFYKKNIEKTSLDQQKFERDIKIAQSLQKKILPKNIGKRIKNSGIKIVAKSETLFEVGGDFYDYYMLDDEHVLFTIGDVAGKGIPASLFMIFSQTTMRSIARPGMNAGEIVTKLNERILEENVSDLFFTLFLGIINIKTGALQYCNAAHNYPFLINSSGSLEELDDTHGIPIGIYAEKVYGYSEILMRKDDQLLVYTDGLVDTIDENEMAYSVDVLKYNLLGTWFLEPGEIIKKIFDGIENFRGNVKAVDDMTVVALKYSPRRKDDILKE